MSLITSISNYVSDQASSKPQMILIFIVITIIFLLYSQRLFGITDNYYNTIMACFIIVIMCSIILTTFLNILRITNNEYILKFSDIFNSPGSKNFFAVFLLLLFVMFVYELPLYDNNNTHAITNKLMFGHNGVLSNRTFGIMLIFGFCISTAYMIYKTTRESIK